MTSQPAKRTELDTPSTPTHHTSKTIPSLPVEVFHRIISHIDHNDKRTLGRCMRVSPAFNAMAAPRLYNTVTLRESSGLSNPLSGVTRGVFDIPVKKAWMKKKRDKQKTQGKEMDLGFVRHVFLEELLNINQLAISNQPADKGRLSNSVKSLRLAFHHQHNLAYLETTEMIAQFTSIEKIVFTGDGLQARVPLGCLSYTCKKGVIIINGPLGIVPQLYLNAKWTSGSLLSVICVFIDKERSYHDGESLRRLAAVLINIATAPGCLKTLTIVNPPSYRGPEMADMPLCIYIEKVSQSRRKGHARILLSEPQSNVASPPPQYPKIESISMVEYLRTHDWSGEFTDEEVEPWLEAEDAERIAAYHASQKQAEEE